MVPNGDYPHGAPGRPPTADDVIKLCDALNKAGCRYMVIGGIAMNYYGRSRMTQDIDLLVDPSAVNIERAKQGLSILADNAAAEIEPDDVRTLAVVRVCDEILVDLMGAAGDVTFEKAEAIEAGFGVTTVPIADVKTLMATKHGERSKDKEDLMFLFHAYREEAGGSEPPKRRGSHV